MSVLRMRLPRYVCWALAGACLLAYPFFLLTWLSNLFDARYFTVLGVVACTGAAVLVLIRVAIGVVTGWPAAVADRALAVWMGRFFVGFLLGILVAAVWYEIARPYPPEQRERILGGGTQFFGSTLGGAAAMVLTGWIGRRPRGRLLLPLAWTAVFAAIVGVSFAAFS